MAMITTGEFDDDVPTGVAGASRIALIAASVPLLTMRTISIEGTALMINSAISDSTSVGAP